VGVIYDIYNNNHAYIIYFKYTEEFLTGTSQEGLARSTLDKQCAQRCKTCLAPMSKSLKDVS
jgi:hypothetical protein